MTITQALIVEHTVFDTVFNQVVRALRKAQTAAEVKMLATLVEGVLRNHGDKEENLAYLALDHVLADKGELHSLYQEHQEIDDRWKRVQGAKDFTEARQLLKAALYAAREHFRSEERVIFPVVEQVLRRETLIELGQVWLQQAAPGSRAAAVAARTQ